VYNNANTSYPLTDGLGSVRGMVNSMSDVLSTTTYSPYGVPDSPISGFAFTGEQRDTNGLQYHRARYYNAGLGTWASLDPFEGIHDRPMSLNGYSWVEGNVVNMVDPSGLAYNIWVAAFISPPEINFPFARVLPGGLTILDFNATWHGDDRSWYSGGELPVSSRVWFQIKLDEGLSEPIMIEANQSLEVGTWKTGVGETRVTASAFGNRYEFQETAPTPNSDSVKISERGEAKVLTIQAYVGNPLVSYSPPIHLIYDVWFIPCESKVDLWAGHDVYPWHEFYLLPENDPWGLEYQRIPSGFNQNPSDLVGPISIQYIQSLQIPSLDKNCVQVINPTQKVLSSYGLKC
jgi:RHS repeat-associated protein